MDAITLHACVEYLCHGSADVYTFASDYLPTVRIGNKPLIVICNTGSSEGKGEHWVGFYTYYCKEGKIKSEYYDSFAEPLRFYGLVYPYPITKQNTVVHQNDYTNFCGQLTLYFFHLRLRRSPLYYALRQLSQNKDRNEQLALVFFQRIVTVAGRNIRPHFSCGNYGCLPKAQVLEKRKELK